MTTIISEPMQRSRGMRDLLPADMRAFRQVEDAFRAAASRWGYDEIRTPTLETYSLFTAAGALTPEMLSRVYSFLDWDGWSGERVVLRPDSTIPVTRAAYEGGIEPPARLSYIQNVFRFAEAGDREHEHRDGADERERPRGQARRGAIGRSSSHGDVLHRRSERRRGAIACPARAVPRRWRA